MDTDAHRSEDPLDSVTHQIIGAAFEVINTLGHGLHEKPYELALAIECKPRGLSIEQQARYPVRCKGHIVGEFVPDLVVGGSVVVDTKVVDQLGPVERGQMINYLRITRLRLGLLINFSRPKLAWERVAL